MKIFIKKIPGTSGLMTTNFLNTKINEVKNKTDDHGKYIATKELKKLTAEKFAAR